MRRAADSNKVVRTVLECLVMLAALVFLLSPASYAQPPDAALVSPDVTVDLSGTILDDEDVGRDELAGVVAVVNIGVIPPETDVTAYHKLPGGDQLLSFDTTVTLPAAVGTVTVDPGDVARFSGAAYSIEFDASANGVPAGLRTDAVGRVGPDLLLSFDTTGDLGGGLTADDEDLVRFDGAFSMFFDGSANGVPTSLDLDGVHYIVSGGDLLLSFDGSGKVGGVDFDDEDVLEFNPGGGTWALVYDASTEHAGWLGADLDALYADLFSDGDALPDAGDNCVLVDNPSQGDADSDQYGNACDCDYEQNLTCGFSDFTIFLDCFGLATGPGVGPVDDPSCEESDQDENGTVGFGDFTLFLNGFGGPPGPSCCAL